MRRRLNRNEKFPRLYSTKFPKNIEDSKEATFVPYSDFRKLEERYERLMRKYLDSKRLTILEEAWYHPIREEDYEGYEIFDFKSDECDECIEVAIIPRKHAAGDTP